LFADAVRGASESESESLPNCTGGKRRVFEVGAVDVIDGAVVELVSGSSIDDMSNDRPSSVETDILGGSSVESRGFRPPFFVGDNLSLIEDEKEVRGGEID
jgi:hypothetical protein